MESAIPICCNACHYLVGDDVDDGIHLHCRECGAEVVVSNLRASEVVAQGFWFRFVFKEGK